MPAPHPTDGLLGRELRVEPLGTVRVTAWLHRGALFDVLQAEHQGRAVCLKTPSLSPSARGEEVFASLTHSDETNVFITSAGGTAVIAAREALLGQLLTLEAQRIRDTAGAWNHQVIALGVWDPEPERSHLGLDDLLREEARFRPVLVTPLHPGCTFGQLDRGLQRKLFPRMLPALWDALTAAPHGDLSPENLVCDLAGGRFVLIDPGVVMRSLRPRRGPGLDEEVTVTTTNAEHYPVLSPAFDLLLGQPTGEIPTLGAIIMPWRPRREGQPAASDLQAAGILYHRLLTGRHPLYGTLPGWEVHQPLWVGSFSDRPTRGANDPRRGVLDRPGGFAPPSRLQPDVSRPEDALCKALLDLQVESRGALLDLARAASA